MASHDLCTLSDSCPAGCAGVCGRRVVAVRAVGGVAVIDDGAVAESAEPKSPKLSGKCAAKSGAALFACTDSGRYPRGGICWLDRLADSGQAVPRQYKKNQYASQVSV